jgi:hypothetical protein
MTVSVRLPPRVEQELADYCVSEKVTKSEAIKRALEKLFLDRQSPMPNSPAARRFIGADKRQGDVARHTKRLLRKGKRG